MDLLHAQDYSDMTPLQIGQKMKDRKKNDLEIQKNML